MNSKILTKAIKALALFLFFTMANQAFSQDIPEGKSIYEAECTACHTIGEGARVGPDLEGLFDRREEDWIKRKIYEPGALRDEGDAITQELIDEYGTPMAPVGISEEEVDHVMAYLEQFKEGHEVAVEGGGFPPGILYSSLIGLAAVIIITLITYTVGLKKA